MNSTLLLRLDYLRGIKIGEIYELKDFAFFMKNAIYDLHVEEAPKNEDLALCFQYSENGWQLLNKSSAVHCAVNEITLTPNHWFHLHDGDILEWGLSIWQINPEEQIYTNPEFETTNIIPSTKEIIPLELTWFDPQKQKENAEENPFDLIIPNLPYELLESTAFKVKDSSQEESPAETIFHELLQEYCHALDAPQLSDNDYVWQKRLLQNNISSSASTINLAELSGNTDPLMTLQDIVSGPLNIDDIFNGLDSLREAELFHIEEIPEVLRLFAPGWQQHIGHTHIPPSLTRKDHHTVSVDSHYRMTQFSNNYQKDSTDDNHQQ